MELLPNDKPGATTDSARLSAADLELALVEHTRSGEGAKLYTKLVDRQGDAEEVRTSRCGREYLDKLPDSARLRALARAFPFARAADRSRVECLDFAMSHGCRTSPDVDKWLKKFGLRSRSTNAWTMVVPPEYRD